MERVESLECPRSLSAFAPDATRLVSEIRAADWIKNGTNVWTGSANAEEWDVKEFDAVHMVEIEKARIDAAEREARA